PRRAGPGKQTSRACVGIRRRQRSDPQPTPAVAAVEAPHRSARAGARGRGGWQALRAGQRLGGADAAAGVPPGPCDLRVHPAGEGRRVLQRHLVRGGAGLRPALRRQSCSTAGRTSRAGGAGCGGGRGWRGPLCLRAGPARLRCLPPGRRPAGPGHRLRAAFAPLVLPSADAKDEPRRGVVLVPVAGQPLAADALHARIDTLARSLGVRVHALASGKSAAGIDLGSDSVKPIRKPAIALVMGQGVSPPEIGAAWHAFDTALGYPTSKLEPAQLGEVSLDRYTTIVLANG